eukprot:13334168-Ditylum_brightwellii.AAC.1
MSGGVGKKLFLAVRVASSSSTTESLEIDQYYSTLSNSSFAAVISSMNTSASGGLGVRSNWRE